MLAKLLQFELILKGSAGLFLLFFPITTARVFGIPHGQVGLWARLLGAVLVGIAGAIYIEHDVKDLRGLGLPGLIFINLVATMTLLSLVVINGAGSRRAGIAIWTTIAVLFCVSLLQILQA